MKIIIPTFEKIEWMPPTITLFKKLVELGHEITYITIFPDSYFNDERIHNVFLCKKEIELYSKIPHTKIISGVLYYTDIAIKKIISHRLKTVLERVLDNNSRLWIVNELTVLYAGTSFWQNKDFLFTIYELHNKSFKTRNIVKTAQNAKRVIVPEYCRAQIMKNWFQLKKLPVVLPNKSDIPRNTDLDERGIKAIETLDSIRNTGKKIIIYMGGINRERPLDSLLEAIKMNEKYVLAIMGRRSPYLTELESKYSEHIKYLGYYQPPQHIEIAKHCDIGLLIYVPISKEQSLNALFCAPNKIFEYTGIGLPLIANDIPGLRFSIKYYECGALVDFSDKKDINQALSIIDTNYKKLSSNARAFYSSVNIDKTIADLVSML